MRDKIFWIDLARAIACISVIAVHVPPSNVDGDFGNFAVFLFGRLGVPFFVMISGGLNLTFDGDALSFLKKRVTRILLPFVFWSFIYTVFTVKWPITWGVGLYELLSMTFFASYHHLWFIYLIIGLYLVNPILSKWIQQSSDKEILFYIGIWSVTCVVDSVNLIYPHLQQSRYNVIFSLQYVTGYIGYYVMGYYIINRLHKAAVWNIKAGLLLLSMAGVLVLFFCSMLNGNHFNVLNFLSISTVLFTVSSLLLIKSISIVSESLKKVITDVANASFSVYFVHMLFVDSLIIYLQPYFNGFIQSYVIMTVNVLITFILSYFTIKVLYNVPNSKYLIG